MQKALFGWLLFALTATAGGEGRPVVGLVLEGGSALGLSHIGVIEWLERHRIPIDRIAGTSMGGLVGGFYAAGLTTAEIRRIVSEVEWDRILQGRVAFADLAYRRKEDQTTYPAHMEFGLRNGVMLPGGLNHGQEIGLILSRVALPYWNLRSFDDLPIPFRCTGTELVSGEQKVFDSGSLAEALRATMAMPALFTPVKHEGRVYVDGGLLNNLPVDVARAMGAEFVIAVYLERSPFDPNKPASLFSVLDRSITAMVLANEERNLRAADVVVSVDLEGYRGTDYTKLAALVERGYQAAERRSAALAKLTLGETEWQRYLGSRASRHRPVSSRWDFVEVQGGGASQRPLERSLVPLAVGPVDKGRIEQALRRIAGWGRFGRLEYGTTLREGREGLLVRAVEKEHGPPFVRPFVQVDGAELDHVRFRLGSRINFLDLGGYRSELRADLSIGTVNQLAAEYYRPLWEGSPWFVAPRAFMRHSALVFSPRDRTRSEYRLDESGAGLDVGYGLRRNAEIRAGYERVRLAGRGRAGLPPFPDAELSTGVASARVAYEGQDDALIPRRGFRAASGARWFTSSAAGRGDPAADARVSFFQPVGRASSVFIGGEGGAIVGAQGESALRFYTLGGPFRLGSHGPNELVGHRYFILTGGYLREIAELGPPLTDKLYALGFCQAGRAYGASATRSLAVDVSGALAVKTAVGPIFFGGSWGEGGRGRWYFGLGRLF